MKKRDVKGVGGGGYESEQRKMKNNNKIGIEIIEAFQMAGPCHSLAHMERAVNYWANSNNIHTHTIQETRHGTDDMATPKSVWECLVYKRTAFKLCHSKMA